MLLIRVQYASLTSDMLAVSVTLSLHFSLGGDFDTLKYIDNLLVRIYVFPY